MYLSARPTISIFLPVAAGPTQGPDPAFTALMGQHTKSGDDKRACFFPQQKFPRKDGKQNYIKVFKNFNHL